MTEINREDADILAQFVQDFHNSCHATLLNVVSSELSAAIPNDLTALQEKTQQLLDRLRDRKSKKIFDKKRKAIGYQFLPVDIADELIPILNRAVLLKRATLASELEGPLSRTFDVSATSQLEQRLLDVEKFMKRDWFANKNPVEVPSLSDYLATECVEKFEKDLSLDPRIYDEKFHILLAPGLFYSDLRYYRKKCSTRNIGLTVVYLDIDKFKDFNSKYGETTVDRIILPRFMQLLERHVYTHGMAYRYGGDEYTMILPNMSVALAKQFVEELRSKLTEVDYPGIEVPLTVSIGLYHVNKDCIYTDREIEDKANIAKNTAKNKGRDRVEVYEENKLC